MATSIGELKGITETLKEALANQGIKHNEHLLKAASTPPLRRELARTCGVEEKAVLELANRADLSRVKGVAGVYSDLLEQAGVDTVKELATRVPKNLHAKIMEVNESRQLTAKPPTEDDVTGWVAQARDLPKTLTY